MTEQEARKLMCIAKFGEPEDEWRMRKARIGTVSNQFGLVDADGAALRGLQVEFQVFRPQRIAAEKITLTLFRVELRSRTTRIYQMDINKGRRLRPGDHAFSHEHVGDARYDATEDWGTLTVEAAVAMFCSRCSLTLQAPLPAVDAFKLR